MIAAYSFGEVLWTMLIFFFWMMAIWVFISLFADIFRRNDISGFAKAGWIFLLFVLPFLGALIYIIARPKMTEQDKERMEKMQAAQRRVERLLGRRRDRQAHQAPRLRRHHGGGVRGDEAPGDDPGLSRARGRRPAWRRRGRRLSAPAPFPSSGPAFTARPLFDRLAPGRGPPTVSPSVVPATLEGACT